MVLLKNVSCHHTDAKSLKNQIFSQSFAKTLSPVLQLKSKMVQSKLD